MCLLIRGKGVLEDRLQGHEGPRGLRTRERSKVGWVSLQYHPNHPRDKRLVQRPICQPARRDRTGLTLMPVNGDMFIGLSAGTTGTRTDCRTPVGSRQNAPRYGEAKGTITCIMDKPRSSKVTRP